MPVAVLTTVGFLLWSVWFREASLLSRATKLADLADWRGLIGHSKDDWPDRYEWLSTDELFTYGLYLDPPGRLRFNLTRGAKIPTQLRTFYVLAPTDRNLTPFTRTDRKKVTATLFMPDGTKINWRVGGRLKPGTPKKYVGITTVNMPTMYAEVPWQRANEGGSAWQGLARFDDGWHRVVVDLARSEITDFPLTRDPEGGKPEPYGSRGGKVAPKFRLRPLGFLPDGRALVQESAFYNGKNIALTILDPRNPQAPGVPSAIALPPKQTIERVQLSPDGKRLVWHFFPEWQSGFSFWLHQKLPQLLGPAPIEQEIWVSKWDGTDFRRLGSIRMNRRSKNFASGGRTDVFGVKWMPDSKRISFIHGGALYSVDAGP